MSRSVSVCLCAVLVFMAVSSVRLLNPERVFAASGTVSMETPLHESPAHNAPVLALLPEGTVVSIDGPPVEGFYPVSTGEMSGWMRGETLQLEKDIPYEGDAPMRPAAYDVFTARDLAGPKYIPEATFVAVRDDEVIGYGRLAWMDRVDRIGEHAMLAVRRAWRGRGIASARNAP